MDFGTLLHFAQFIPVFIIMLCVLVAAHEYGHYLAARMFGMGVEEFAIGFGKRPIWTWLRKSYDVQTVEGPAGPSTPICATDGSSALKLEESPAPSQLKLTVKETTDFTVRPWPLGGFVRIKGMVPEEDGSETKIPGGFYSKAPWKRFIVLLAGPVFSVLAGQIILFGIFMIWGQPSAPKHARFEEVFANGPAANAGIKPGDLILSINGQPVSKPFDVVKEIRDNAGKALPIEYKQGDKVVKSTITPILEDEPSEVQDEKLEATGVKRRQGKLAGRWESSYEPISIADAAKTSALAPVAVVVGLADMFSKPETIKDSVGGPAAIAVATSDAVKKGLDRILIMCAMLSISVGIFNLLPIPPLDGGQMLVAFVEMLRGGRRLSLQVQGAIVAAGMAMVLMIFVSVILLDVTRFTQGDRRIEQIKKSK
jgi:regulator of sigma E protease